MIPQIRRMEAGDRSAVAELICVSTNYWYEARGMGRIFPDGPRSADVFYEVYSALQGSAGLVAELDGQLAGSCFYHERPTHVSLGIMNAHPNYFGRGVARALLAYIVGRADALQMPLRLVSSALNLDSFSLYTRAGFVPRCLYQDVVVDVPEAGLDTPPSALASVRAARPEDVESMAALERTLCGIDRGGDYRHFVDNREGFWNVCVCEHGGQLTGFLVASRDMLGPGVAQSEDGAAALIYQQLLGRPGRSTLFLVPAECASLVRQVYAWGGRNCELHVTQVRGQYSPMRGIALPAFMPETG